MKIFLKHDIQTCKVPPWSEARKPNNLDAIEKGTTGIDQMRRAF